MNTKMVGTVLLSGLMFAGCGGSATKTQNVAPAPAKPAAAPTTPTSVSTPAGNAAVGSLPADFPKDVPIYTGAGITSASTAGGNVGAVLTTSDDPAKVASFYKDELAKNGWSKPQAVDMAGTSSITATKEKRRVAVTITKAQDGKTNVSIGVTQMP